MSLWDILFMLICLLAIFVVWLVKRPESEVVPYSRGHVPSWGNFPKEEEQ